MGIDMGSWLQGKVLHTVKKEHRHQRLKWIPESFFAFLWRDHHRGCLKYSAFFSCCRCIPIIWLHMLTVVTIDMMQSWCLKNTQIDHKHTPWLSKPHRGKVEISGHNFEVKADFSIQQNIWKALYRLKVKSICFLNGRYQK